MLLPACACAQFSSNVVQITFADFVQSFGYIQQVSDYLEAHNELDKLAGVALKRIQHFYYKTGEFVCSLAGNGALVLRQRRIGTWSPIWPAVWQEVVCSAFLVPLLILSDAPVAPYPTTADVVYSAMRKLALQQQEESAHAAAAAAPVAEAEVMDGEDAEGATGRPCGHLKHYVCLCAHVCLSRTCMCFPAPSHMLQS